MPHTCHAVRTMTVNTSTVDTTQHHNPPAQRMKLHDLGLPGETATSFSQAVNADPGSVPVSCVTSRDLGGPVERQRRPGAEAVGSSAGVRNPSFASDRFQHPSVRRWTYECAAAHHTDGSTTASLTAAIAAIALSALGRRLRLLPTVLGERLAHVNHFVEAALFITSDVALISRVRFDEFSFAGHADEIPISRRNGNTERPTGSTHVWDRRRCVSSPTVRRCEPRDCHAPSASVT